MAFAARSGDCIIVPPAAGVLRGLDDGGLALWLCAKAGKAKAPDRVTASAVAHSLLFVCITISLLAQSARCVELLPVDWVVSLSQPPFCSLQAANVIFAYHSPVFAVLDS